MTKISFFTILCINFLLISCSDNPTGFSSVDFENLRWSKMESNMSVPLRKVWGSSSTDVYAVGSGDLFHYNGSSWNKVNLDTSYFINDIWGTNANNIYAVGKHGLLIHYDGLSWNKITTNSNFAFSRIFCLDNGTILIQRIFNNLIKYKNGILITQPFNSPISVSAIWGIESNLHPFTSKITDNFIFLNIFRNIEIGSEDRIEPMQSSPGAYNDIHGTSMNNIFIVGTSARAIYFDGFQGHTINLPKDKAEKLTGVWTVGERKAIFIGYTGKIFYFVDDELREQESGTSETLFDIWGSDDGTFFVVGNSGIILKSSN